MLIEHRCTIKQLLESGVHLGHKKNICNPKMKKYILGIKNNMHIINLKKTIIYIYKALVAIFKIISIGGNIMFVNTKKHE